jgi:hypothetical protein
MGLTAAVLLAIAVRLRRRARLTGARPAPAPPPPRLGPRGVLVAGTVAVLAALAFLGAGLWPGQSVRTPMTILDAPVQDVARTGERTLEIRYADEPGR